MFFGIGLPKIRIAFQRSWTGSKVVGQIPTQLEGWTYSTDSNVVGHIQRSRKDSNAVGQIVQIRLESY